LRIAASAARKRMVTMQRAPAARIGRWCDAINAKTFSSAKTFSV
jgi:hypothetical protein